MTTIRFDDEAHAKRREYMRTWYLRRSERVKSWAARYRAANIDAVRAYDRERGARPTDFVVPRFAKRAHLAVYRAIKKGSIVRPEIGECGHRGRIEAAHEDYSDPMVFRWLCQSCHRRWDRLEPKTRVQQMKLGL